MRRAMRVGLIVAMAMICTGAVSWTKTKEAQRFIWALGMTESGNDPNAIGDKGMAIGAYQLHKCFVDDCNRILRKKEFTYADRWSPAKSIKMINVYQTHYATDRRIGRTVTVQDRAAMHCSGPNGYKKRFKVKAVKAYVDKFMIHYRKAKK